MERWWIALGTRQSNIVEVCRLQAYPLPSCPDAWRGQPCPKPAGRSVDFDCPGFTELVRSQYQQGRALGVRSPIIAQRRHGPLQSCVSRVLRNSHSERPEPYDS